MGTLYGEDKASYAPIEKEDAKSPVLLTQLRKDAIRRVFKEHGVALEENDDDDDKIEQLVEEAFAIWVNARYRTIPNYFANSVLSCLQEISALRTNAKNSHGDDDSKSVLIGAITDGNSDPTVIPELADFFDFCINAETVGISKPDKRVYLRGVARALQHPSLQDISPINYSLNESVGSKRLTEEALEDLVGPWWVHIGDDFVKDCVAAKNLNMRTIWARELVREKNVKEEAWKTAAESSKQKRTVEELVKEVAELEVIEMQVGADNYLANSLEAEFADAVADEFRDVASILQKWQEEAAAYSADVTSETSRESDELLETVQPQPVEKTKAAQDEKQPMEPSTSNDTKFCIHCGAKLPSVAKFCSSCGEKQ